MFLDPNKLSEASPAEILESAAQAHLGLDHRFLNALLSRPDESRAAAVAFAEKDRSRDLVDLAPDLIALFRHWNAPEAIPFLIEQIRQDPENIPDEATELLVGFGSSALDPLLALYEDLPEEDSGEVAFILASLRVRDPRILKALTGRLEFDLGDAAFLLGIYGDPAALPALEEAAAHLSDSEVELRREIADTREAIATGRPHTATEDEPFRIHELYPETADVPVDLLDEDERTELLAHPIPAVRAAAASSFFNRELNKVQIQSLVHLAQTDPEPAVRARAWEALSLTTEETEVVNAMLTALRRPDLDVEEHGGLAVGLSAEADRNEVRTAFNKLYEIPAGRAKAMEAMWRSMHPSFRDRFARHLADPELEVRRAALWGIGYYGIRAELENIRKLFLDEELRSDALFAYTLALPGEVSRGRITGMLTRIEKDAHGLTEMEEELVKTALDEKLMLAGKEPFFTPQED
ncbi:MAG TPA: hypothetical protein VH351_05550 [Bryobacteraceae bacterium]|nr:hypothetical protein [Bryobacteraceae bacterium]